MERIYKEAVLLAHNLVGREDIIEASWLDYRTGAYLMIREAVLEAKKNQQTLIVPSISKE